MSRSRVGYNMNWHKIVNLKFCMPRTYNLILWLAGLMEQTSAKTLSFFFSYKITKMKIKSFECPKSIRNNEKKILGTSDACSLSRLSHRPSKPAYCIVDCWILDSSLVCCWSDKTGIFKVMT